MSGPSERDEIAALAKWLTENGMVDHGWRCAYPETYGPCECADVDAAELLASDWLAERDRRTAAKTLREAADEIGEGPGISRFIGMDELSAAVRAEKRAQDWLHARADRIERGQ